jgi:flagellar biosynthesis protein FlhF
MKIKKFRARTFSEAIVLVKRELGHEAVILASEEQKGLVPAVEVTAAVDYDMSADSRAMSSYSRYSGAGSQAAGISGNASLTGSNASLQKSSSAPRRHDSGSMDSLRQEISVLRNMIEEMKGSGFGIELPGQRKKVFNYLKKRAVNDDLALKIASDDPQSMDELVSKVSKDLKTYDDVKTGRIIMLVGPTGVGKTTTLAKLAARAVRNRKKAAMISLDTYRIGAIEQIRIYSKVIGIPLEVVSRAADLKKAVGKFSDRDLIFIDTTGRNPGDRRYIEELKGIFSLGMEIETHLLMSACSDDDFLSASYGSYRELPIDCIAFTKIDEAVKYGSIYNLASLCRKPVAYVTNGQSVPDDIAFPKSEQLAKMIVRNEVSL